MKNHEKVAVSIIIPTMNRTDSLARTLEVLMRSNQIPTQVIIIDQSTDSNVQTMIRSTVMQYKDLTEMKYVFQPYPSSAAARNLGISHVSNPICIFMDDDVDVHVDTLKKVYDIFMENEKISMLGGLNELQSMGVKGGNLGYLFFKKSYKNRKIGCVTRGMYGRYPVHVTGRVDTQWAMGYFFAVRTDLMNEWNVRFDENLTGYSYGEDLDFTYTFYKNSKAQGYSCILDSTVYVKHNHTNEWRIPPRKETFMQVFNREYFSYKHFQGPFSRLFTRWSNFGTLLERIVNKPRASMDVLEAQIYCDLYRKKIKLGEFPYNKIKRI